MAGPVAKFPPRDQLEPLALSACGDRFRWTAAKAAEGVELKGKTVLVTGGTSGIGVPVVKAMAKTGARVIVTARNEAKGDKLVAEVKEELGAHVEVWAMDLADLGSIDALVAKAKDEKVVFDLVLNNAGVMAVPEFTKTKDGFELQLQVNYIAPSVLLHGLLSDNCIADEGRIVVVSSIAAKRLGAPGPAAYNLDAVNWADADSYNKWLAYSYAKGMIIMHCNLLAKTLLGKGSKVTVNTVHPGGIATGLQDGLTLDEMKALGWFDSEGTVHPLFKSADEGASTEVWVAVSEEMAGKTGTYCEDCRVTAKDDFGSDESPVHQSRGTAAYLWVEDNWAKLLAAAEAKVGRKLM